MAIIGFEKGSGKRSRVREKSVKSQGILIRIMSGNPALPGLQKSVALAEQKHKRNEDNPIKIVFDLKMLNVSNSQGNVETRLYSNVSTF